MTLVRLRVEPVVAGDVDRHLAEIGVVRLVRADAGLWVEVEADAVPRASAMLFRAGMRVTSVGAPGPATQGLVAGIVTHLEPLRASGVVDVVTARALDEGEATARLARRSIVRRRPDREAIRAVLAGSDRVFVWRRAVYGTPGAIRALRGVRPAVFDRGAPEREHERLAFVGRSALRGWLA